MTMHKGVNRAICAPSRPGRITVASTPSHASCAPAAPSPPHRGWPPRLGTPPKGVSALFYKGLMATALGSTRTIFFGGWQFFSS